jgi:hypothetical protein
VFLAVFPGNNGGTGIFFSKDRREEVIEVEEEAETALVSGSKEPVKLMMQGEWMKGCPEGNEQSFLFALYDFLSTNSCPCPQSCGYKLDRKRSDFFPLVVSLGGVSPCLTAHHIP